MSMRSRVATVKSGISDEHEWLEVRRAGKLLGLVWMKGTLSCPMVQSNLCPPPAYFWVDGGYQAHSRPS
ncbi:MAG: hypothetical protein ACREDT_05680 [Methylocella sp.]